MLKPGSQSGHSEIVQTSQPEGIGDAIVPGGDGLARQATSATADPILTVGPSPEDQDEDTDVDGDDLLKMFAATGIEAVDRTAIVALAGEVDIDDIVAELQLVAAALDLTRRYSVPKAA